MSWEPVNECQITARCQTRFVKMTVIPCFALTNMHIDKEKDVVYGVLSTLTNKVPKHDMLVAMGDFNAKVGNDNKKFFDQHGRETQRTM